MDNTSTQIPAWVMLSLFLAILVILAIFGDLFTFIVGAFIMSIVFSNGYNRRHLKED